MENISFVGIVQINPIAGNLKYNAEKIAYYIKKAQKSNLDLVVFPELSLMGYPIEDTIIRYPFLVEENLKWLKGLAKITDKTAVIVGFVEPKLKNDDGKPFYNSLAILQYGKVQGVVRKSLLPTYCEFNDYRYFEPSHVVGVQEGETLGKFNKNILINNPKCYKINGINYGISICEDIWNDEDFFENNLYSKNPILELVNDGADIIINCSASPSRVKKEQLKHNMLSYIANKYKTPIIYVNQVGAIDNISFDGTSRVYNKDGKLIARAKSFEEDFLTVNPIKNIGKIYPLVNGLEKSLNEQKIFTLEYNSDLERTYKTILQGIKDYFSKCGLKRAVLGLSGGLDSTICAVLLADALGKENVYGISMPSNLTSSSNKNDAEILAKNLGINFAQIPIEKIVKTADKTLQELFLQVNQNWKNYRYQKSFTMDNIQARSRAMYLWGISNEYQNCIPIATSDKSEIYMGYATINGDMSGGFAPIADVTKTKLFALAKWLNKNRTIKNVIPESVISKKPTAELAIDSKTGKTLLAEDALMPYEFLDEIIWRIENKNENYLDMLNNKFIYEEKNVISYEQKREWLDKFFNRMSKALYKWSILPPSVIVDSHSINKNDYRQPITSGVDYHIVSPEIIEKTLSMNFCKL